MDVPREIIQSMGESGREAMVAGLSPVKGIIIQSVWSVRQQRNRTPLEKLYLAGK